MPIIAQKQSVQCNAKKEHGESKIFIGKIAISLSAITLCSKIFGFAEKQVVAYFFGTDNQADVYFATMGAVLSLFFLIKELIYPSLLPVFAGSLKISPFVSAALFKKVFIRLLIILATITLLITLFSKEITFFIVPGFSNDNKVLTSSLLKFLGPGCFFLYFSTLTYTVLNCRKMFFKAAIPEAVFKLIIAAGLFVLAPLIGLYAIAIVLTLASILMFISQFIFIPESKTIFSYSLDKGQDEFNKFLKLIGPLVIGVVFSHIGGLVDNNLASKLPEGQLSFLNYSKKLIDAILLVGPVALVTVVYTQLGHLNAEGKYEEFKTLFLKTLRLILFLGIPCSVLLVILRVPVIAALFQRGRFTAQSTAGTSTALFIYAAGLVTFSVETLVVYGFCALSNTKTPVRFGVIGVLLHILLAVCFIRPFGFVAIAWAFVFSKTIKVIILLLIMDRKFNFLDGRFIYFILKISFSCLVSALCLYQFKDLNLGSSFVHILIFDFTVPSAGFATIFLVCCRLFKIEELNLLLSILTHKRDLKYQLIKDAL